VTFLVPQVAGTLVSPEKPLAAQGDWLQVLLQESFLDEFYAAVSGLDQGNPSPSLPHTFRWPDQRISLTVFQDEGDMLLGTQSHKQER